MRQPGDENGQRLIEDGARTSRINAEVAQLVRGDATADTQFQPSARKLVQHADFFNEAEGVIEWQQVNKWSQAELPGALGGGGEE